MPERRSGRRRRQALDAAIQRQARVGAAGGRRRRGFRQEFGEALHGRVLWRAEGGGDDGKGKGVWRKGWGWGDGTVTTQ